MSEPRIHSHVTDRLPDDHPLADRRVYCDRCETLLHLQTNSCMRTWIETGCGNYCMRCFVVAAGGLAPDQTRLGGVDCLPRSFALEVAPSESGRAPMAGRPSGGDHGGAGGAAPPASRGAQSPRAPAAAVRSGS